jgi:hypothetical protein
MASGSCGFESRPRHRVVTRYREEDASRSGGRGSSGRLAYTRSGTRARRSCFAAAYRRRRSGGSSDITRGTSRRQAIRSPPPRLRERRGHRWSGTARTADPPSRRFRCLDREGAARAHAGSVDLTTQVTAASATMPKRAHRCRRDMSDESRQEPAAEWETTGRRCSPSRGLRSAASYGVMPAA